MRKFLSISLLVGAFTVFAIISKAQSVTGSIGSGSVARGATVRGLVVLNIPPGLHINSHRPNSEFAIPTVIKLKSIGTKLGSVMYPRGKVKKFEFSDKPIIVYEGRVSFRFNVTVPANFKGKIIRVKALVTFQACTNEVCYAPKTKEITLSAKVK